MLAKENIVVQDDISRMLCHAVTTKIDYTESINDLYSLILDITNTLKISSLFKVTIKDINLFKKEAGFTIFTVDNDKIISEIELSRKVFLQFNNKESNNLKNEALATIYHELYHIYDKEILFNAFKSVKINSTVY